MKKIDKIVVEFQELNRFPKLRVVSQKWHDDGEPQYPNSLQSTTNFLPHVAPPKEGVDTYVEKSTHDDAMGSPVWETVPV